MKYQENTLATVGMLLFVIVVATIAAVWWSPKTKNATDYPDSVDCLPLDGSGPVTCVDVVQPEEPGEAKAYCKTNEGTVIGCDMWIRRG